MVPPSTARAEVVEALRHRAGAVNEFMVRYTPCHLHLSQPLPGCKAAGSGFSPRVCLDPRAEGGQSGEGRLWERRHKPVTETQSDGDGGRTDTSAQMHFWGTILNL